MIWESHPWKVDLLKRADWLLARRKQRRWSESADVKVEQCVMVGCYCIRKLVEAKKLTDQVATQKVVLASFPSTGRPVHHFNWHHVDRLYHLDRATNTTRPLQFVCNQIIHSYIFMNGFDEKDKLDFFLFSSDRERRSRLYGITLTDLVGTFQSVARDGSSSGAFKWNARRGDYDITNE